jgi:hypothetical protein
MFSTYILGDSVVTLDSEGVVEGDISKELAAKLAGHPNWLEVADKVVEKPVKVAKKVVAKKSKKSSKKKD